MQSKPSKSEFIDLAHIPGFTGREDCQRGWHILAKNLLLGSILDVGAGLGLSKTRMPCVTQDPAPGLSVDIADPVDRIQSSQYDCVTAFDVIEHVREDVDFLLDLRRIAIHQLFITTPNLEVSRAGNGCHCREYSPAEFVDLIERVSTNNIWYVGDGEGLRPRAVSRYDFLSHREPHQAVMILTGSNSERWNPWYKGLKVTESPRPYGTSPTYEMAANYLGEDPVEDWGCGMGWFKQFAKGPYFGIDGTHSPFANEVQDLYLRVQSGKNIFMRGVIEHDWRWRKILNNALLSFKNKMALVLFTPMSDGHTKQIAFNKEIGVPDISFQERDLIKAFKIHDVRYRFEDVDSQTAYGRERIYYLEEQ